MKNIILLFALILISRNAFSVCSSPISRVNNGANAVLTSTKYNLDVNTAYTRLNELPGDCVTNETITSAKILNGTIVNADISASAAIARSKLATTNYVISTVGSGSFSTSSVTYVDVTGLTLSITTTGGPVEISLINSDNSSLSNVSAQVTGTSAAVSLKLIRGATDVGVQHLFLNGVSGSIESGVPSSSIRFFDTPVAGTYTYKIQGLRVLGTLFVSNAKLLAREL
ncbi:MAG: hypothetical protein M3P98_03120 [bacterium]|nr:hypothetical protein [bacterium]